MRRLASPITRVLALSTVWVALGTTLAQAQEPVAALEATPAPVPPAVPTAIAAPVVDATPTPPVATPTPAISKPAAIRSRKPRRAQLPVVAPVAGQRCTRTPDATRNGTTSAGLGGAAGSVVAAPPGPLTQSGRCQSDPEPKAKRRPSPSKARRGSGSAAVPSDLTGLAGSGPTRIGVPNFFIAKFRIPPFLLSIYQAAGIQYGIRWELLAAINEIETDYGRNLNVSTAGALGWMQFMPATWRAYGVDANHDGVKDPYNPVDAIFASARYLRAAGGHANVRSAVFAYNHADWYVDSVLRRARLIGGLPADLIGSLTGLTQGHFPVEAKASYSGSRDVRERKVVRGNAASIVQSNDARKGMDLFARPESRVVAVNDGRILQVGSSPRLGRFVRLQDVYGNAYTYGHLGQVAKRYPAPRRRHVSLAAIRRELKLPRDPRPTRPASTRRARSRGRRAPKASPVRRERTATKERLFANPARRGAGGHRRSASRPGSGEHLRFEPKRFEAKPLRRGARVLAGTVLGRVGGTRAGKAPHVRFEIRPAGRGAPRVDPKPVLDGWKLLGSSAVYRAEKRNAFFGDAAGRPSIGQLLLMGKEELERRVLANPDIELYSCGRGDVRSGLIDRRVLAALEYLAASGLRPTVSSLRCGHGIRTSSGNVSEHSTGDAVDIAAVNGIPIVGHQGRGSVTEQAIQRLLGLQGAMKPHQIISLMTFEGADNTFAMGDHDDHIHLGWRPLYSTSGGTASQISAVLKPDQWAKLIDRLSSIDNPAVRLTPSRYSVKVVKRPAKSR